MNDELKKVWEEQKEFNENFYALPTNDKERSLQTKEYVLHLISEADELLRTTRAWKFHRHDSLFMVNRESVKEELADIFKYWVTLCIVWGVSPKEAMESFWRKSMVVRQRYQQEFVKDLTGDIAVIDIDNVLADYTAGFLTWMREKYPRMRGSVERYMRTRQTPGVHFNADSFRIDDGVWQLIKHNFRVSGEKKNLPLIPGASEFLRELRDMNIKIVLLTSRPINEYPNIHADTIEWLKKNDMPFDFIWWSKEKHETLMLHGIRGRVLFAVDDDPAFVIKLSQIGIRTFFFNRLQTFTKMFDASNETIREVANFEPIIEFASRERKTK